MRSEISFLNVFFYNKVKVILTYYFKMSNILFDFKNDLYSHNKKLKL